jgi:preprotein translocase subunit SecY|uniref:Protein translocase subunit SecY n=1 Tax=Octactis speculum TaxID=3111310 RepID=A0A514CPQ3_9STRA|nr:preprotein translocase subunit SecY [Dictyocha speculum]QDH81744.1 preprotein translocase subunit SecY [Dictyocha speculum]
MNNNSKSLQSRLFNTFLIILLVRTGTYIPVPNVDQEYLKNILYSIPLLRNFYTNENLVLGIFSLGILPYINASIMIQLLVSIIPSLEKLQKEEGERGRKKIIEYTRYLTLVWAIIDSVSIAVALRPILFVQSFTIFSQIIITLITGSMIVLWLSDLITENGLGNGSSIIITLNILSTFPKTIKTVIDISNPTSAAVNFFTFSLLIICVIYVQEAVRIIPLISAKQLTSNFGNNTKNSYLPLKINQSGIMPIIFASTILTVINLLINYLVGLNILPNFFTNVEFQSILFRILNFVLIIAFSLFYSNLILNPKELAKDLNKMAVTIPGVRPGNQTSEFLQNMLKRLTLIGALFLAITVTVPKVNAYGFGVTSLLILVGVTLETSRQIQTLLISESYKTYI